MNIQQLRYLREIVRCDLNLTRAAERLHTSQPGMSRRIKELEDELGIEIFQRRGRRLEGLTDAGQTALKLASDALDRIEQLQRVASEHDESSGGVLTIATTHTQARYTLPPIVLAFRARYPNVSIVLKQSDPVQASRLTLDSEADLAMATEVLAKVEGLKAQAFLQWGHVLLCPPDHPLAEVDRLTLEDIAQFPLLTYDAAFAGRTSIDRVFAEANLQPEIAMSALDADVIKTYVRTGLGVGLVASLAYDKQQDAPLVAKDCEHLFGTKTSYVAVRIGSNQRGFVREFIEMIPGIGVGIHV
ncbi:MAG: LysR substrate-binding domain-containing protein [Burkholderiaceae bacterium]